MKESQRIRSLFAKQYDDDPWLGVNLVDKLAQISSEQAVYKFSPKTNSIWEILNHMISWRELVLQGIPQNSYSSPTHNFIEPIINPSEKEWEKTLERLDKSQTSWIEFLSTIEESIFDEEFGNKKYSYYELIMGILHHDIYHLGQISLLVRLLSERIKPL